MAVEPATRASAREAHPTVFVDTFTDGLLGPEVEVLGPVEDGGHILVNTAPGCWGPMITPSIRGGHEGAQPVAVARAEPRDPIPVFAPHALGALATRLRPFMGQLGTTPSTTIPDSHNAGDFGAFLVGAPHRYAMDAQALQQHKTDGHLDIDAVRAGAVLVCPVKLPGGGVYLGDMHALQGDGEIAGHTADVSGTVTLQVEVLKGSLGIDGPVLLPLEEDLPFLARPLTEAERVRARALAARWGVAGVEDSAPISVI